MRFLLIAGLLFSATHFSFAQVGFTAAYYSQSIPEWESAVFGLRSNERLLENGYSGEVDFRITPIENYRVEFFPTLTYNLSNSSMGRLSESFELTQYEFGLKTNIFLLSLEADCDCPTFRREAGIMKKGFFVQIAPALSYFDGKIEDKIATTDETQIISEANGLSFKLGLGMGLEIGLSDYVTITPIIKYNRYFGLEWENLQSDLSNFYVDEIMDGSDNSPVNQFYAGIRLGFKFRP